MSAVHPQIQALIDDWAGDETPPSLEAQRSGYLQTAIELGGPVELVADIEDVVIPRPDGGRLHARVYRPMLAAARAGALVWMHGGGWVAGDLEGFDRVARQLANASGATTVIVDYRLAPEHPFPLPADDARAAVDWACGAGAAQLGTDPSLVVVGGDSAGGHLAALAALHARERLLAQMYVYPALDPDCDSEAYELHGTGTTLGASEMRFFWEAYLNGSAQPRAASAREVPDDARVLGADLRGLPPAWIAVAEHDPLRDDGLRHALALRAAGVRVETVVYDDMTHGFMRWGGLVERAHELIGWLGGAVRELLAR